MNLIFCLGAKRSELGRPGRDGQNCILINGYPNYTNRKE
jgi:hypothetical protein